MGNVWGRKSNSPELEEAEEEHASGSIEMRGSQPLEASARRNRSLSSWPLCLPDRSMRGYSNSTRSTANTQDTSTSGRGDPRSMDNSACKGATAGHSGESQSLPGNAFREGGEAVCNIDSSEVLGACPNGEEYHEIKFTLRIPCTSSNDLPKDKMQEELLLKERQWQTAVRALAMKTQECEGLVQVVRELTSSRNKLTNIKSIQGERFADLQHDFMRVSRIADLSRALSRENVAKAAHLGQLLNQAEEELARQRLTNQQVKDQYARLKLENTDLREKISLIERLDVLAYRRESACLVEYQQLHLKETY